MIDPASIATGVVTQLVTQKTLEQVNTITENVTGKSPPDKLDVVIALLAQIVQGVSQDERFNKDFPMILQPYPYEYIIDETWCEKPHFCAFFAVSTALQIQTEGAGTFLKTVGPGWVQLDIRGRLSTSDGTNKNVILSYREQPIGVAI
jgi:hypothetical protein